MSVLRSVVLRRPTTLLVGFALVGVLVVPAAAEPTSADLRSQMERAEARLQDIHMELAEVVEDYNEAAVALEASEAQLFATEQEHEAVSGEVATLSVAAEDHIRRIHKLGPGLELSSVFATGNPTDAGAKAATLRRVLAGQRADLEGLAAARTTVAATEIRLAEQREEAAANAEAVAERRDAVEALIASRQAEIDQLQSEIEAAEAREEEERRRREEERLRREAEERARQQAEERARQDAAAQARAAREAEEQAAAQRRQQASSAPSTSGGSTSGGSGDSSGGSSAPAPAPSTRRSAQTAVDTALAQVGKPYQWGGSGPNSFDCSGLTSFAWRAAGVEITRTSRSQYAATKRVSRADLQPGDLVFYSRSGPAGISHVAMYIGNGRIVEASRAGVPVRVSDTGLSRSDIIGYGRP